MTPKERAKQLRTTELLRLGPAKRPWFVADAIEGTQIFGATGSGKTSGSGRALALSFLKNGFGGLVLTAKPDDLSLWEEYIAEAGRPAEDLIVVGFDRGHRFNFLDYEYSRPGRGRRLTQNLVSLFITALEPDGAGRSTSDPYWEHALRQLLTNAIDTVALSGRPVTLREILEAILSAPRSIEPSSESLQRSQCAVMLREASRQKLSEDDRKDLEQCIDYWGYDFAGLAERTRSVIVSSFTSRATSLLRGPLRTVFCGDTERTFEPEDSHRGKVIVLDLPVKEYGDIGRFAQVLFKTIWQKATERRDDLRDTLEAADGTTQPNPRFNPDFRPVFLWADESQHFATTEDVYFQATARSSLAATVYLTQNISNYYAIMGGKDPKAATDSFLGNLVTKIFHANGDPATNEWAERLFGRRVAMGRGGSLPLQQQQQQQQGFTASFQEIEAPFIRGSRFTALKAGGPPHFKVESVIFHPRTIAHDPDQPFIEHTFEQPKAFRESNP